MSTHQLGSLLEIARLEFFDTVGDELLEIVVDVFLHKDALGAHAYLGIVYIRRCM